MMTPGTHYEVPAMFFSAPQANEPVQHTPLRTVLARKKEEELAFQPRDHVDQVDRSDDSGEQMTRENFEGELPSIGSEAHFDGSCKRCAFFSKGRCKNGKDCTHCHFSHEARPRLRKRYAGEARVRARRSTQIENAYPENDSSKTDDVVVPTFLVDQASVTSMINNLSDSDSDDDTPVVDAASKEVSGAIAIMKFNDALEEAAKAHAADAMQNSVTESDLQAAKAHSVDAMQNSVTDSDLMRDSADFDTTASVSCLSALSDEEKAPPSENSDSEVASVQEETQKEETPSTSISRKFDALGASPTSWSASRKTASLGNSTAKDIERLTRGLLNKLTAERFESLSKQILALPLSTPEHLAVLAAEIFAKATTQDCFRNLYTDLCIRLDAHLAPQTSVVGGRAFRKALVNECQSTFEHYLQPADPAVFADLNSEECFEIHVKLKTQRLGNMRFIGDLLVRRLLAPKMLPAIVHELLSGDEDALESVIALITVVAPEFEKNTSQIAIYQAPLRDAYQVLRRKHDDGSICLRMRCQINDLFDAKARSWAPRTVCA